MRGIVVLIVSLLLLVGCVEKKSTDSNLEKLIEDEQAANLVVEVTSNPQEVKLLEPVKITATVTENNIPVSKEATEIWFELIKKDRAALGTVTPESVGDGKYQIETILDEEGIYQIIAHVTVGSIHEMPVYEINVTK